MAEHDPKQFLIHSLSFPPGGDQRSDGRNAKQATIRFLKEVCLPHRQVHMLTFEDREGRMWNYISSLEQEENGRWYEMGSASFRSQEHQRKRATHTSPWVYLVGGGWGNLGENWGDRFWAGGYRTDNAPDAQRIRLLFKNGLVLEESIQDDLALFLTEQKVQVPVQVEVYNQSGKLLGTQRAFQYEEEEDTFSSKT